MKYIIEIKPEYEDSFKGVMILGARESNLYVDTLSIEDLEELNSDYINEHYGELQDEAYQKGYEDGKASAERGCDGCKHEHAEADGNPCRVCRACTRGYIDQYEPAPHSDRIEVGDEVVFEAEGAEPFVILHKYYDDAGYPSEYRYSVYAQNGEVLTFNEGDGPKKTGRHFQETNKLLEAMRQ